MSKETAYHERDMLVAALSAIYPSHLCRHPDADADWDDDWRWIVCIHLPTGQATWHIHASELPLFSHLVRDENHWDGHTTEEKYRRLLELRSWHNQARDEDSLLANAIRMMPEGTELRRVRVSEGHEHWIHCRIGPSHCDDVCVAHDPYRALSRG